MMMTDVNELIWVVLNPIEIKFIQSHPIVLPQKNYIFTNKEKKILPTKSKMKSTFKIHIWNFS